MQRYFVIGPRGEAECDNAGDVITYPSYQSATEHCGPHSSVAMYTSDEAHALIAAKDGEIARLRKNYFDVADAITASSKGVEDLCDQARAIRKARDEAQVKLERLESANAGLVAALGRIANSTIEDQDGIGHVWGEWLRDLAREALKAK